jgi:hypothetical protein
MDRAMVEDDVIVERYGSPRVAIVAFARYQELLEAERELLRMRLQQTSAQVSQRAQDLSDEDIDALIEDTRQEVSEEHHR